MIFFGICIWISLLMIWGISISYLVLRLCLFCWHFLVSKTLYSCSSSEVQDLEATPVSSLMAQSTSLFAFEGDPLDDVTIYRSTVGTLKYLSLARPNINFKVNKLSQYMHCPTSIHWHYVKRLLCYLKQALHFGLQLRCSIFHSFQAFYDADWARCRSG